MFLLIFTFYELSSVPNVLFLLSDLFGACSPIAFLWTDKCSFCEQINDCCDDDNNNEIIDELISLEFSGIYVMLAF